MKAIVITRPGGPEVLEEKEITAPEPGRGEVRVRVRAFALNRADLLQCRGQYPAPPGWPADIPGLEYAGEVESVASDVGNVAVGDRVMGIVGGGSYAEYLVTPASHLLQIPGNLSYEAAAAVPEAFITAYDALERVRAVAGEWVLVHAVGSGVGTAVVQLVKQRGARSIGTSRTRAKLEQAGNLGMDIGVESVSEDLVTAVRRATVGGANAAVDLIGGDLFPKTVEAMATRGRIVIVGLTGGARADLDLGAVLRKRILIEGTVLRSRSNAEKADLVGAFRTDVLPALSEGKLLPVVDRVFEFREIRAAHEYLLTNGNFGNVVVGVA